MQTTILSQNRYWATMSKLADSDKVSYNTWFLKEACRAAILRHSFDLQSSNWRESAPGQTLNLIMTRVLIVDDQPAFRQQLTSVLFYAGLIVAGEASSIKEALEILPDLSVDLAIVDVEMPVINGVEGTRLLKEAAPQLRVILVSIVSDPSSMLDQAAANVGAEAFIPKDCLSLEVIKGWDR